MQNRELREDGSFELREDGSFELREGEDDVDDTIIRFGPLRPGLDLTVTTLHRPEPRRDAVAGGVTLEIVAEFIPGEAHGSATVPGVVIEAARPTMDQVRLWSAARGRVHLGLYKSLFDAAQTDREKLNILDLLVIDSLEDLLRH
jgi:hypothetical protein